VTRWALGITGLAGAVGVALELAGVHSGARSVLVLLFLAIAPTAAIAGLLRTVDVLARLVIACTANIAILTLTGIIMIGEGVWSPTGGLLVVSGLTAACAIVQLPPVRQRLTARTASWRMAVGSGIALSNGHVVSVWNGSLERFLSGIRVKTDPSTRYEYHHDGDLQTARLLSSTTEVVGGFQVRQRGRGVVAVANEDKVTERREKAFLELSTKPSSWSPVQASDVNRVFRGESEPANPSVFVRDDGTALLYPRRVNLFMGESESCKTWASLIAVAQEIRKGNIACIVDFEDSAEMTIDRLRQLGLTEEQINEGVVCCSPDSPFDIVAQAHLERHLGDLCNSSKRKLTLAVVDSVNEAMLVEGLDPEVGRDVARFCHGLPRWLTDRGPAVVLVEHIAKPGDSRGRAPMGGERTINSVDGAAYVFAEVSPFGRGVAGKVKVSLVKDRGGFIRQYAPAKVVGTMTLTSSLQDGSVTTSFAPPPAGRRSATRRSPSKASD
jgi:hypothetical protein